MGLDIPGVYLCLPPLQCNDLVLDSLGTTKVSFNNSLKDCQEEYPLQASIILRESSIEKMLVCFPLDECAQRLKFNFTHKFSYDNFPTDWRSQQLDI